MSVKLDVDYGKVAYEGMAKMSRASASMTASAKKANTYVPKQVATDGARSPAEYGRSVTHMPIDQ